jgi:hypothetical protein
LWREVVEIKMSDTYQQIPELELDLKDKDRVSYFECRICQCVIEDRDLEKDPRTPENPGCIIHPECDCNTDKGWYSNGDVV